MKSDGSHTLPDGMELREWIDGQALLWHGRMVALVTPLASGRARSARCIGTVHLQHEFHGDVATGVRFICAWARAWHERIAEVYGDLATGQCATGEAAGHPATDKSDDVRSGRRRRRSR